jgi:hypothetical protein
VVFTSKNVQLGWRGTAHEQLFFEDGLSPSNVGFFKGDGLHTDEDPSEYHMDPTHYDDNLMRKAMKNVNPGHYKLFGNNCQTYADKLRAEYNRLLKLEQLFGPTHQ